MDAFYGQICAFPFNFAPPGWLLCDGKTLPIQQYTALFALLGTTFGGDGRTNFALPDLRGRMAVGTADLGGSTNGLSKISIGESGGSSQVTLGVNNLPAHMHMLPAQLEDGTSKQPVSGGVPAKLTDSLGFGVQAYGQPGSDQLAPQALAPAGGSAPVPVQNPSLGVSFYISTQGIFPSRP